MVTGQSHALPSLHNISTVNLAHLVASFLPFSGAAILRTHTGIRRLFAGTGSLPSTKSKDFCAGLGGANRSSIEAASSSARTSMNCSISVRSAWRKFETLFNRVRRTSAICPLLQASKYSTKRLSRSSAVAGRTNPLLKTDADNCANGATTAATGGSQFVHFPYTYQKSQWSGAHVPCFGKGSSHGSRDDDRLGKAGSRNSGTNRGDTTIALSGSRESFPGGQARDLHRAWSDVHASKSAAAHGALSTVTSQYFVSPVFTSVWRLASLVLIGVFSSSIVSGNELPDSPAPKVFAESAPKHVTDYRPFWDKANKIEFGAMLTLATIDQVDTCRFLSQGRHEDWLTQSCGKNVALTVGFVAAAAAGAWLLHRTAHYKLERVPMAYMAAASSAGIAYSATQTPVKLVCVPAKFGPGETCH